MLTVVVPTLDSERTLARTLGSLVLAATEGVVTQVVVADGGSSDATLEIADGFGCDIVRAPRGRGPQLAAGAAAARRPWLLFLHADTVLEDGWEGAVATFIQRQEKKTPAHRRAAFFRFALDDDGMRAWLLERAVALRGLLLALPYGDQGLLIAADHYRAIGGFRDLPLMEDVDIVRRIGRRRLAMLRPRAVTSADRYVSEGYFARIARNMLCLALYYLRVPPRVIARIYG